MTLEQFRFDIAVAHSPLHGELILPEAARGIAVFVDACGSGERAAAGDAAARLQARGFGTLAIDLLSGNECHFAEAEHHLPLLSERLLAVIGQVHRLMDSEALPRLPLGLIAAGSATPLAVRVAALRDQDVGAVVCHGGLVDIAGLQYLKVLQAPLLLIADDGDGDDFAVHNLLRAKRYLPGIIAIEYLPAPPADPAAAVTELTARWFEHHLAH